MSAICGIYYSDGRPVTRATGANMMRELGIYRADTTGTWQKSQVFFGCHAQHITPESVGENLPYSDNLTGLTITADAIIDNRADLFDKLSINHSQRNGMSDGMLILQTYRKWGQECSKYLLGDYAFVIWDKKKRELFCAVDHTGTRTFYYFRNKELFAFATLIKPLFVLPEINKEHNDIWIADFLAMPALVNQLDPELTLYENIYLLPAGHTLTVGHDGDVKKSIYWQVERYPVLKMKSDEEYAEALREVLGEAVRCRLRSIRPVGVMMSGGLDSTSVACMAARELAVSGRRLTAFSAVPMPGYRNWLHASNLADETPYIEAVREYNGNIDVRYINSDGIHSLSNTNRFFAMLEQPYKIIENLFWLDNIMASAKECDIGVILMGSAGNNTISYGYVQPYLISLFRSRHYYRLLCESWAVARTKRRPMRALLGLYKSLVPYELKKKLKPFKNFNSYNMSFLDLVPINPDFAQRTSVQERFHQFGYDPLYRSIQDSFETRQKRLSPGYFSHLSVFMTKLSLAHGVAMRDPTMDKRVIEFCLSMPESQYVHKSKERLLIRRSMVGILPDKVRLNETIHGTQSADWTQRLQPCWPELVAEIGNIGINEAERKYLDINKIQRELAKASTLKDNAADDFNFRMLIRSLIFSRFLRYEETQQDVNATRVV